MREHDGFYLRLALGAGRLSDQMQTTSDSDFGATVETSAVGPSAAIEIAFGGTIGRGLVLGGGIYGDGVGERASSEELTRDGESILSGDEGVEFEGMGATLIGPFVDFYFDPNMGFHGQAAIGLGGVGAGRGRVGDLTVVPEHQANGFGVMLGVGYEFWIGEQWSLGALVRMLYVSAESDEVDGSTWQHQAFALPTVLLSLTYH